MQFSNDIPVKKASESLSITHRSRILNLRQRHTFPCRPLGLVFGIFYFALCLTAALGAEVTDMVINNAQGELLLSVKIRDVITAEVSPSVMQEVSATIIFSIALYQVSRFWFDKKIAHHTATNTIKYEPLKKEYRLMRSWQSGPPLVVESLDQARRLMTEVDHLRLMPLAHLKKNRNYQIRVQAVCQDHHAFIFSSSGCFRTDWHTVDFTF